MLDVAPHVFLKREQPPRAALQNAIPGSVSAVSFWVGDWTVVNATDGSPAGDNRIERRLDGCAITESWRGIVKGDDGMSLFTYDARRHNWDQVWVTQDTSRPGGLPVY